MAMESVRSAFHAQLATVMDSLLAAAVCEIAKIFESSLSEQQAELAHKTEEINILRGKLEKVERRQKVKGGRSEGGEPTSADSKDSLKESRQKASEMNVEKDASSHLNAEGLSQSLRELKEEVTGHDGPSIKPEYAGSGTLLESTRVSEGSHPAVHQRQINPPATQAKSKLSHWDHGSHSADDRPLEDPAFAPFLSMSQLPGLDAPQGGMSSLENLQADSGTDASTFRSGFVSDETSNEGNGGSLNFLDQESENQNSVLEQRGTRQVQTTSGGGPWRPTDDRCGRGPINNTRRFTPFGSRDPLRPQSNSQMLTPRHANSHSNPAASSGGNDRPYTCPYCTKCFSYPSHQRRHLLRHTGVRLHPCQFCEKSFLTPSELTVHTRTHTGERPFGCAQCGKRFARSGNLRAHQRDVHLGKRPFACTECGKRFAHKGNLRVHNHRVHQGDPYYIDDQQESDIVPNPI